MTEQRAQHAESLAEEWLICGQHESNPVSQRVAERWEQNYRWIAQSERNEAER